MASKLPPYDRGLIIVAPHGGLIALGEKTVIVKSRPFRFADGAGRPWRLLLISDKRALALIELRPPVAITLAAFAAMSAAHRITDEERRRWWPAKRRLYAYAVTRCRRFRRAVPVEYGPGPQVTVTPERLRVRC